MRRIRQFVCHARCRTVSLALSVLCAFCLGLPGQAHAQSAGDAVFGGHAVAQLAQRDRVTLDQAIAIAKRRYEGTVVKAETTTRNGRTVHEVRIINKENRVRTFRIDAESGEDRG